MWDKEFFKMIFRAIYTLLVSVWTGMYLWNVTFNPGDTSRFTEFIVGFILGTLISTLINFYFGGSDGTKATRMASRASDLLSNGNSMPEKPKVLPGDDA